MVKLARIHTSSPHYGKNAPLLTIQIASSAFLSIDIQTYFTKHDISPSEFHYINVSTVAASASEFLSMGDALSKANALIEKATSADALLSTPFISKHVIFSDAVTRVLSPLDGRSEVGKFLCIGMNYIDHCTEQNVPVPEVPLVFSKFGSCVVGPGDASKLHAYNDCCCSDFTYLCISI